MGRMRVPRHGANRVRRPVPTSDLDRLAQAHTESVPTRNLYDVDEGAPPWERRRPGDEARVGFLLRITEYERELLRYVAEREERSMNRTARRYLVEALEGAARAYAVESKSSESSG